MMFNNKYSIKINKDINKIINTQTKIHTNNHNTINNHTFKDSSLKANLIKDNSLIKVNSQTKVNSQIKANSQIKVKFLNNKDSTINLTDKIINNNKHLLLQIQDTNLILASNKVN